MTEHTRQRSLEVLLCPGQLRPTEAHRTPNVSSAETCRGDLPGSRVGPLGGSWPAWHRQALQMNGEEGRNFLSPVGHAPQLRIKARETVDSEMTSLC